MNFDTSAMFIRALQSLSYLFIGIKFLIDMPKGVIRKWVLLNGHSIILSMMIDTILVIGKGLQRGETVSAVQCLLDLFECNFSGNQIEYIWQFAILF